MEQIALELAKTAVVLQETYLELSLSEERAASAEERLELMEALMKGWHAEESPDDVSK